MKTASSKTPKAPLLLAIDTSCDDTSVAVTKGWTILSNVIASQTELHKPFGGVFPTVAKQAHKEHIKPAIATALKRAGVGIDEIDAIAITQGPGLAPALEVGINAAKELAQAHNKPLVAVNHIEAHALSVLAQPKQQKAKMQSSKQTSKMSAGGFMQLDGLTQSGELRTQVTFPALSLVISGGHSLFILVKNFGEYEILGTTIDDAAGECLDKVGRLVNLGYPAGPTIEQFAKKGDPKRFAFPLPMTQSGDFNLSFSGLKTHARNFVEQKTAQAPFTKQDVYDFCASIQYAVFRHICHKLDKILDQYSVQEVWLGGGVAANAALRSMLRQTIAMHPALNSTRNDSSKMASITPLRTPHTKRLCMDNGAMIGVVAAMRMGQKGTGAFVRAEELDRKPRLSIATRG